jgi:phosphomannomutase/phosphoglucomutase
MNPSIFREYDLRGLAGKDFDESFARLLGKVHGTMIRDKGGKKAAVGRDVRPTSDSYADAAIEGLQSAGLDVYDIGISPSPLLYFSLFHLELDGGIQITASHNPSEYNGFKLCVGKETLYGAQIQEVRKRMENGSFSERPKGRRESYPIIPPYQEYVLRDIPALARPLKVVIDAGNGVAGPVAPPIFRQLGCTVWEIACIPDGTFPLHHPDPTIPENLNDLIRTVKANKADLGIAYDGDGDRIGVVDEQGKILWGDELLILFARDVLASHPGAVVISEVKCSQRLFDQISLHGGVPIMWKAGHSLLKAKMKETHSLLAGEMSGHMFFADRYFGYDDAIYASMRLLELLARAERPLSALLEDLPKTASTPEIRVDCPDETKFVIAERAKEYFRKHYEVIDVDGVRVQFPDGWGLVRASNTQPALVLRFEAKTSEKLNEYRSIIEEKLKELQTAVEEEDAGQDRH